MSRAHGTDYGRSDRVPALAVDGLYKTFGRGWVLEDLSLEVPVGSLTAILGPSGSGKTTLLRVVAGFERADQGAVVLSGRPVDRRRLWVSPEDRGIGYVPQEGGLFPHLDAEDNVAFGLRRSRRRGRRHQGFGGHHHIHRHGGHGRSLVRQYIEMVGLAGFEHRYPHQLSGGQQQRVALARALAVEPELVLLDEPFSSLDVSLRASVRDDLQRVLRESGKTAVLVTHDQDEALSIADQVAIIQHGRIGQVGAPAELYAKPADPEIARFLGAANLVTGTLRGGGAVTALGTLSLRSPGADRPVDGTPALVLIRPEQIEISPIGRPTGAIAGLAGRVIHAEFYGHDCVTGVQPTEECGVDLITVRSQGGEAPRVGEEVTLVATGSTVAWPKT
ncbi:MAG TPA: ABC transporter ATP-binding protein [Acidimicrobiales bacterium]|nr:ABC transporter ATP-binding protein [Acidimicrobiales bacterium]